ncbi:hypothetical protein GCM10008096_14640 [Zhihengliuella salsuginis]|uniref:Uncharacterized protein n=1 Tax=Zhihengliuella salsuginis TaxID=578222 RepID=A0ABQ3GII1_9MICC|nr:hypothetical protein GCM10008096_14640 [Zhihengliuella salsuginis]
MVYIDAGAQLTTWESPSAISTAAGSLKVNGAAFHRQFESSAATWQGLSSAYRGPEKERLVGAASLAESQARFVADATGLAERTLNDLASRLQGLIARREALVADTSAFNRRNSETAAHELDGYEANQYRVLDDDLLRLQREYEETIEECARTLRGVRAGHVHEGEFYDHDLVDLRKASFDAGAAVLPGIELPSTATVTTMTHAVWKFADGLTWDSPPSAVTRTIEKGAALYGVPLSSGLAGISNALLRRSHSGEPFRDRFLREFKSRLISSTPLVGDAAAWKESRKHALPVPGVTGSTTTTSGAAGEMLKTVSTDIVDRVSGVNARPLLVRTGAALGTAGTALTVGFEFNDQYKQNKQQVAQEHPEMTADEVSTEAAHDAGANTLGRTAASIVAAAGAGALAGSVIPGPGTLIGFAGGILGGIAAEVDFLPDVDGDGQKDSIADATGQFFEDRWDDMRGAD